MNESPILRFSATCALVVSLAVPSALGSEIRYPSFPPPRVDAPQALRSSSASTLLLLASSESRGAHPVAASSALTELIEAELAPKPPEGVVEFARAFYRALGEPALPAFLAGETEIRAYNGNTHESLVFHVDANGNVRDEEMAAVKHLFRCRRSGRRHAMHPRVLSLLAELQNRFPGHVIEIVSGYRIKPYGAPKSKHFHGRAIDLRVQGVDITEVRDFLWTRRTDEMGLGYYRGQKFVHMDYRQGYPKTAWTSKHEGDTYRYHPKWSRR